LLEESDELEYRQKFIALIERKFIDKEACLNTLACLEASLKEQNINSSKLASLTSDIKKKLDQFW